MARPRVRTPLVVDRIIKSLSLAPYFPGKKIERPSAPGRRWTFSGPFLRYLPSATGYLSILSPGLENQAVTVDYDGEKSARVSRRGEVAGRVTTLADPPSFIKLNARYAV